MSKDFNLPPEPNSGPKRIPINIPGTIPTAKKAIVVGASTAVSALKRLSFNLPPSDPADEVIGFSYLGTPVYTQIVIKDTIGRVTIPGQMSGEGWAVFQSAFCVVSQERNIIRTPIQGRNGTVKEYISDDDYQIEIIGAIVSPYRDVAPHEDLYNIVKLMQTQNEIVIVSDFISQFGISDVVINGGNFRQVPGMRNQIDFTIRLYSDDPTEIQLGITNA